MSNLSSQTWRTAIDLEATCRWPPQSPSGSMDCRDWLRRQQAVVAMGRRAIAPPAPELGIFMQDSAALIAELLNMEHCAVAEPSQDGSALQVTLTLNNRTGGRKTFVHQTSTAGSDSLVGYVLQVAHSVVVTQLSQEQRFQDPFLRKHGIQGAIAVPLRLQDRSFGALVACGSQVLEHKTEDLLFAETIAHLVTTTTARTEAEKMLAANRRVVDGLLQALGAVVLVLNTQGQIVRINRACEQLTAFSLAELKGRLIWNVFPLPEEIGLFRVIFQRLQEGDWPVEFESSLLTKHSQQRRIAWSYGAILGPGESIESIIATGIDITAQRQAEERARHAELKIEDLQLKTCNSTGASGDGSPLIDDEQSHTFARTAAIIHGERRRRPRRSYPYHQLIAPIVDGKLPDRSDFVRVECNDIAAGGFSYLAAAPPPSDSLIVALGTPPKLTYVCAQIVHITRVKRSGKYGYVVGCTYTGRAAY